MYRALPLRHAAIHIRVRPSRPASIVNGGGERLGKVQSSELKRPHDLDLDLGSGHTASRRVSVIDLYLRTKVH